MGHDRQLVILDVRRADPAQDRDRVDGRGGHTGHRDPRVPAGDGGGGDEDADEEPSQWRQAGQPGEAEGEEHRCHRGAPGEAANTGQVATDTVLLQARHRLEARLDGQHKDDQAEEKSDHPAGRLEVARPAAPHQGAEHESALEAGTEPDQTAHAPGGHAEQRGIEAGGRAQHPGHHHPGVHGGAETTHHHPNQGDAAGRHGDAHHGARNRPAAGGGHLEHPVVKGGRPHQVGEPQQREGESQPLQRR